MTKAKESFFLISMMTLIVALAACAAPSGAELMEMNRSGKWKQAESTGMAMIRAPGAMNREYIHAIYFNVIYAKARLGKKHEAMALISSYEEMALKTDLATEDLWVPLELAKLKDELGLLSDPRSALIAAMEENGRKHYPAAAYLCDRVLANSSSNDVQKATAQFVAAACAIRLRDAAEAEKRLAAFDALKAALPAGHEALRAEEEARKDLNALKARVSAPQNRPLFQVQM